MKIAIHHRENSFSIRWIMYCQDNQIDYELVDCRSSNILDVLDNFDIILWHWEPEDYNVAIPLIKSLENKNIKVFPNYNTCWHFDNKIFQKFLFSTYNFNFPKTSLFFSKEEALTFCKTCEIPIISKLSNGASSVNVVKHKSRSSLKKHIIKSFGRGHSAYSRKNIFDDLVGNFKKKRSFRSLLGVVYGIYILVFGLNRSKKLGKERGYVYLQEFVAGNTYDTRLVVIGNRCFGMVRYNRPNDFRASGSGKLVYDKNLIDIEMVRYAFSLNSKLKMQSAAFDFIYSKGQIVLVEVSYGFAVGKAYENCHGYFDKELIWHDKKVLPESFIIEDLLLEKQ